MKLKLTPKLVLIFFLFGLGMLMGVGIQGDRRGRAALEAATVTELESTAGEKEAALDAWVYEREANLAALASSPYILEEQTKFLEAGPGSASASDRLTRELAVHTGPGQSFLSLFILSPKNGQVIIATDPDEKGNFKADRGYFIERKTGAYTSAIYYSAEFQVPAMTTAAPLRSERGQLLGVLVGRLNLHELNTIIQRRSGLRETDDAFLVNSSNVFVTQPRFIHDPAVLRQGVHTEPVGRCMEGGKGTISAEDYRGVPVIAAYRWLPEREMCLIVTLEQAEAFASVHALEKVLRWIAFGTLLVASLVSMALSRLIVNPIVAMQRAAQRYGRGDLDVRLPEGRYDELGALAHEFNQMAASLADKENQLRSYSVELEERVTERTTELQQSEARLKDAQHLAHLGSWELDLSSSKLRWSDEIYQILEIDPQISELTYDAFLDSLNTEDREKVVRAYYASLQDKTPYEVIHRFFTKDGRVRVIHERGQTFYDENGEPVRSIGTSQDITELKSAEEALAASQKRFQALIENAPDGIALLGMDGRLRQVTPSTQQILGYSLQDAEGQDPGALTHPDDLPSLLGLLNDLIQNPGKVVTTQYRFQHKDGSWRWLDSTISNLLAEPGLEALVFNYRDITDRRQAEEALRDSETRYRTLMEGSVEAIYLYELETRRVIVANPAFWNLLGYEAGEVDQLTLYDIVAHDRDSIDRYLEQVLAEGGISIGERLWRRKDGTTVPVEVTANRVQQSGRDIMFVVGRDITERKRAEEVLREKEHLLSDAQRIGHIGSWSYDILADVIKFSDEMYRLFDILPEEFDHNRKDLLALVYPSDRPEAAKWMEDIKDGRQTRELDFRIFRKNGELRYLHFTGAVNFNENGQATRFVGTAQDVTERKVAEIQINQQVKRLTALGEIDRAIVSSFDQKYTLGVILSQVISQLQVDAADVLLLDADGQTLNYSAGQGFRTKLVESAQVRIGESYAGRVASERRLVQILDLQEKPVMPAFSTFIVGEGFASYIGVPLIIKGRVKGVLEVFQRMPLQRYPEWLDFLQALAGQTAIAVENAALFENLHMPPG